MTNDQPQPANVRALHASLTSGSVIVVAVFGFLLSKGRVPLAPDTATTPMVALVITAISAACLLGGLLVLKPAVPKRRTGQSVEEYFQSQEMSGRAVLLWTVLEGGVLIGTIGFGITGSVYPALPALAGLVCLVVFGPRHFAGE